ncbi:glycosyltransferase [candidate division KSB1 bacterium]|nr:glycosyltransferase [candidate division KSB1 bacterium]RQW07611.1 MAG: glycosyltransferase [candidate division KSB1 bacterium]
MAEIKISVVTVCKNEARTVERTIKSVINQTFSDLEYIFIDGQSSDGTLDIVKKYSDFCRIYSGPDAGIYDAMNRGIDAAKGDYIIFINAGDYLIHEDVLAKCAAVIEGGQQADVFYGNLFYYNPLTGAGWMWRPMRRTRLTMFIECLPHPATFFSRRAFAKNGLFDTSFQIAGDYEWFVRGMEKNQLRYGHIDRIITLFYEGGVSTDRDHQHLLREEKKRIKKMHYSPLGRMLFSSGSFISKNVKFLR